MSEHMIMQYLISGLDSHFKKAISRHESSMTTLIDFLKYAKIEQDLHDTFEKTYYSTSHVDQPFFTGNNPLIPSLTTMIKQPKNSQSYQPHDIRPTHSVQSQSSEFQRNSPTRSWQRLSTTYQNEIRNYSPQRTVTNQHANKQTTFTRHYDNCKICERRNHRTIDCFHKRSTGCFNCGQDHVVRDCSMPPNFQ